MAKWNNLGDRVPGIYAINVLEENVENRVDMQNMIAPKKKNQRKTQKEPIYSDDEEGYYEKNYQKKA